MRGRTLDLLSSLSKDIKEDLAYIESLKSQSLLQLNYKADDTTWSTLENIEHLNLYGDFYIPELEKAILAAAKTSPKAEFKSSWLGEYFANAMLPAANGDIKKMKTFKSKDPNNSNLSKDIITRFEEQQNELFVLLDKAANVDIRKAKTGTTIATWIKVNVGDILRVVIYHNRRHMNQIRKIKLT